MCGVCACVWCVWCVCVCVWCVCVCVWCVWCVRCVCGMCVVCVWCVCMCVVYGVCGVCVHVCVWCVCGVCVVCVSHDLAADTSYFPYKDLPCPVLLRELMAWCWQQNPADRPTASQIVKTVDTDQFLRLLDGIRVCDTTQVIACGYRIVSAYSKMALGQRSLSGGGRRCSPTTLSSPLTRQRESYEALREDGSHPQTKLASLSEEEDPVRSKAAANEQGGVNGSTVHEVQSHGLDTTVEEPAAMMTETHKQPNEDEVRPKHTCPDDVMHGPSPNENSTPASQYGDDDIICELWVVSSDGHHSIATVIDYTGRFVNTEVSLTQPVIVIITG